MVLRNSNNKRGITLRPHMIPVFQPFLEQYKDVEAVRLPTHYAKVMHWRMAPTPDNMRVTGRIVWTAYDHTACIVLQNGEVYVGVARCSHKDQYCKRTGYELALKRAAELVVERRPDFEVSRWLAGVELRDECRRKCEEQGLM